MKIFITLTFFSFILLANSDYSKNIIFLAHKLHLFGGEKAIIQWERVFSSPRHLKRYRLDSIDADTRQKLKTYLIAHAADSEQPILPGL